MSQIGIIVSLHVHPPDAGQLMVAVKSFELVANKGILEDQRYFGKKRRQVTLIEREQLDEHAAALSLVRIDEGRARSNIETRGIVLHRLIGREVAVGEAVLRFYEDRTPCHKMDAICHGLRKLMEDGKQGVLAQVVKGGTIRVGDPIQLIEGS